MASGDMTVIGADTTIKGEMSFEAGARVLGTFEGKITAGGELQVGEGATCNAELIGKRVVVEGTVNGNIEASDRLTLNATAKIEGDIRAGELVVVEGAAFSGFCDVGPGALEAPARTKIETTPEQVRPPAKQATPPAQPAAPASRGASAPWDSEPAGNHPDAAIIETTKNGAAVLAMGEPRVRAD